MGSDDCSSEKSLRTAAHSPLDQCPTRHREVGSIPIHVAAYRVRSSVLFEQRVICVFPAQERKSSDGPQPRAFPRTRRLKAKVCGPLTGSSRSSCAETK